MESFESLGPADTEMYISYTESLDATYGAESYTDVPYTEPLGSTYTDSYTSIQSVFNTEPFPTEMSTDILPTASVSGESMATAVPNTGMVDVTTGQMNLSSCPFYQELITKYFLVKPDTDSRIGKIRGHEKK